MTHQHSVTCDVCGKTVEVPNTSTSAFGNCDAPGWLRVTGTAPVITADLPHEHRSKQPDLCSWKCVAEYAATRAGIPVSPIPPVPVAPPEAGTGAEPRTWQYLVGGPGCPGCSPAAFLPLPAKVPPEEKPQHD